MLEFLLLVHCHPASHSLQNFLQLDHTPLLVLLQHSTSSLLLAVQAFYVCLALLVAWLGSQILVFEALSLLFLGHLELPKLPWMRRLQLQPHFF